MRQRLLLVACLLSGACGNDAKPGVATDSLGATDIVAQPVSLSEIAPGDTASILLVMRQTMQEIDGMLRSLERRDTTLAAVDDQEARRLSVWLQDGVARKLTVTEPNDAGGMTGESAFWLVGGELRVVQQPFAAYTLYGDRILVWTDSSLDPIPDIPSDNRMEREVVLVAQARQWLEVFGLRLP